MDDLTLRIRDLNLRFKSLFSDTAVLHGISLHIRRGERVALVGESGSGKSVTARIVLGTLQELKTSRISGTVEVMGRDLKKMTEKERYALRGRDISMIFQDPTSSLNPVFRIAELFHEVLKRRDPGISAAAARARAAQMLAQVSIHEPERALDSYAFQLSGGMNQRIMIAMALANEPALLLADEPGTALDVTVQAQTLELMREMVERNATSVLFISHNLGVVREFADRVYVIYKGRIVEHGTTEALFADPRHPYTRALMAAVPRLTGGGIPDVPEVSESFFDPMITHEGLREPEPTR
ncbi:ABC transporter ATP-binding protein [Pseudooceanicola sp. CBS1P-1]|uniref:ATP-binding cassette domain-containing protein n=1 Tax=Pseudooceanicola albus TaxID=2692189 RepID=A0A6L7G4A4_9RHOB|nr:MULTISPECIES: ABC transporter ATP-binding protein [Pseudooceanicola]MBT9385310.1 ABC transporter ATP-binding protein [Pseudooceanicola endophyticus]MXN18831.1 ATP-binding cassette domain-containing protein [Pseudooceanicola albus]